MAELFLLHPEVAGGWGPRTVVANRREIESGEAHVPVVTRCEYQFEGWLGDELLEAFPCFIATKSLAEDLERANLRGVGFDEVIISVSDTFKELYPRRKLPPFRRLIPKGTVELTSQRKIRNWSLDDLCLAQRAELLVSERALAILKKHKLDNCEVEEVSD